MKLSRVKSVWNGSLRTIKHLGSKELDGAGVGIGEIQRSASTAITTNREQCILDPCSINPHCQEPRVIIVGAGMAGLSAANRLTQCGIRNFVILEAKERFV